MMSDDEPASPAHFDALLEYSVGRLSRGEAIRLLGIRDYASLLVALGDAELSMPSRSKAEIEEEAETFVRLWEQEK
jgi:hypothetical protein